MSSERNTRYGRRPQLLAIGNLTRSPSMPTREDVEEDEEEDEEDQEEVEERNGGRGRKARPEKGDMRTILNRLI